MTNPQPNTLNLQEWERWLVVYALHANSGNKIKTAAALGVTYKTVYNLIARHKIEVSEYGGAPAKGA